MKTMMVELASSYGLTKAETSRLSAGLFWATEFGLLRNEQDVNSLNLREALLVSNMIEKVRKTKKCAL